jgi:hypothetical protein
MHSRVIQISTYGLIERRNDIFLATSVDGLMLMAANLPGDATTIAAVIEIKTRTGVEALIHANTLSVTFGKTAQCSIADASYCELIPTIGERWQLLHHAAVIGVKYVYYVEASHSKIIRVVRVMIASTLRSKYRKALRFIKQNYLKWIPYDHTPPDPIPEFPEEMFFGRCPDLHTLLQSLSLFTAIRQLFHFTGKALPCCKSLHSFIVATWNLMKTPIDTTSQELMYIHPAALRHRTSELVLWERLLMITWLGIHQLVGVGSIS